MVARPFARAGTAADPECGPTTLILRSRTERLRYLSTLRAGLAGALIVTLLLATVLSYVVARTMTRPLAAVTDAMRDVAATGDLTRKVTVQSRAWDDEDARLLGVHVQHAHRVDRPLPARGGAARAAVVARAAVHRDRPRGPQPADDHPRVARRRCAASGVSARDVREAVADIDEETQRINRIVTEVLDFAKPIRFDFAEAERERRVPRVGHRGLGRRRARRRAPRSRPRTSRRSSPTPSGCGRCWSTSWPTPGTPCRRSPRADRAAVSASRHRRHPAHRTARRARRHLDRRPRRRASHRTICRTCSTPTTPPAARAPAWACRLQRTSSRGWAAPSS